MGILLFEFLKSLLVFCQTNFAWYVVLPIGQSFFIKLPGIKYQIPRSQLRLIEEVVAPLDHKLFCNTDIIQCHPHAKDFANITP
jgi:hypothetical protein